MSFRLWPLSRVAALGGLWVVLVIASIVFHPSAPWLSSVFHLLGNTKAMGTGDLYVIAFEPWALLGIVLLPPLALLLAWRFARSKLGAAGNGQSAA